MNPIPVWRSCVLRPRILPRPRNAIVALRRPSTRFFADDKSQTLPKAPTGQVGPNMDPQEHVSEEAAKLAKIQGGEGPDLDQGTPINEVLKDDKDGQKQAPKVVKESIKAGTTPTPSTSTGSTRSFSTSARRHADLQSSFNSDALQLDPSLISGADANTNSSTEAGQLGHKFPLPDLPLPPNTHKDHRYDAICKQFIGLLMEDGKKATAERNLSVILNILRTANAPSYSSNRPLLPGAPPASHLPLNPILYLTLAIDSVAPLLRIRSQRGAAGGGVALQIPIPLNQHQRRRTAIKWILDSASKRKSTGSGSDQLAQRIAQEIISVVEGRSAIWDRRMAIHRLGTAARTNVTWQKGRR